MLQVHPSTSNETLTRTSISNIEPETISEKLEIIISNQTTQSKEVQNLQNEVRDIKQYIESLIDENETLRSENRQLKHEFQKNKIELEKIKQKQLLKQIEISGVPDKISQNAASAVIKIAEKVGSNIEEKDIKDLYLKKNNSKKSGEPAKIIIKFHKLGTKINFLENLKKKTISTKIFEMIPNEGETDDDNNAIYINDDNAIYINERLTPYFNFLYKKARDLKKTKNIEYAWVKNGKVFIRKTSSSKVIHVTEENNLNV